MEAELEPYRLRLILPDLAHARLGNSLPTPTAFLTGDNRLFDAPENTSDISKFGSNTLENEVHVDYAAPIFRSGWIEKRNPHEVWLRAGQFPICWPVVKPWEVCDKLESPQVTKILRDTYVHGTGGKSVWLTGSVAGGLIESDNDGVDIHSSCALECPESCPEAELVRNAIYALQGIPTAVAKLEHMSRIFFSTSADRSRHNLSSFWTRSVSSEALGKLLAVVARAGRLRCGLEEFVRYFLDGRPNIVSDYGEFIYNVGSKIKKSKRRAWKVGRKVSGEHLGKDGQAAVFPHCLVNQAFAAAVKSILRGHSAALNTLSASIAIRRLGGIKKSPPEATEQDKNSGPVLGYGCRDITLLEFYLHTRELRVQLQALAFLCLVTDDQSLLGTLRNNIKVPGDSGDDMGCSVGNAKPVGTKNIPKLEHSFRSSASVFDHFPRGADLLTYLHNQLMEVDPLHVALLRFLFKEAYQPYSIFIRTWLYQAAVKDPFNEFVIEQAEPILSTNVPDSGQPRFTEMKIRSNISAPKFLEDVCTPLIRAGQQLQVLLKLPETCEFAQQMASFAMPESISHSSTGSSVGSPTLVFNKNALQKFVQQRHRKTQEMHQHMDRLFAALALKRSQAKENGEHPQSPTSVGRPHKQGAHKVNDVLASELTESTLELEAHVQPETLKLQPRTSSTIAQKLKPIQTDTSLMALVGAQEVETLRKATKRRGWGKDCFTSLGEGPAEIQSSNVTEELVLKEAENALRACSLQSPENALLTNNRENPSSTKHSTTVSREVRTARMTPPTNNEENLTYSTTVTGRVGPTIRMQSLLSDQQRGSSWPKFGLPANPFLGYIDESSHSYTYTIFSGTYHHWDVTTKFGRTDHSHISTFWVPPMISRNYGDAPWFTNLEHSFQSQLFEGLDAQLHSQYPESYAVGIEEETVGEKNEHTSGWTDELTGHPESNKNDTLINSDSSDVASLGHAFGHVEGTSESSLTDQGSLPHSAFEADVDLSQISSGADSPVLEQEIYESQLNKHPEDKDNSNFVGEDFICLEYAGEEEVQESLGTKLYLHSKNDEIQLSGSNASSKEFNAASIKSDGVAGWEQYLQSSYFNKSGSSNSTSHHQVFGDGEDGGEEIPLSVVISTCIAQEIVTQYQFVSIITVKLLQESLCLHDHFLALRRYYFMELGDWAVNFTAALCQHGWALEGQLYQMEVQRMLEAAFQRSSCDGDEYTERVHIIFQGSSLTHFACEAVAPLLNSTRVDAFDNIALGYRVEWPLSLILTPDSRVLYNVVFTFLMRIQLTAHALSDIWQRLQTIGRSLQKNLRSSRKQEQENRLRTLQLFRQQVGHFVTTVQRYAESKLLHIVWGRFLQAIQTEVKDMQDLEYMHRLYLEDAIRQCFLSDESVGVKACIDRIMQCVLDWQSHLRNAVSDGFNDRLDLVDDLLYSRVVEVNRVFQENLRRLHLFHLKPQVRHQTYMADFWTGLDLNNFLANSFSEKK